MIYTGDILIHTNTRRLGAVLEIGRAHHDGSTEYRIRPLPLRCADRASFRAQGLSPDFDIRPDLETWWNSLRVERLLHRDPYRRYLALCIVEDDPAKQGRRAAHPKRRVRRSGGWLAEQIWQEMFWALRHRSRMLPSGEHVYYPLGRDHWERAAVDCLQRRDRARDYWMTRPGPRP